MADKSETRRVWLCCFGIPPQAWSSENMEKIGGKWGDVVYCDYVTESGGAMESAKILIDTCCMEFMKSASI